MVRTWRVTSAASTDAPATRQSGKWEELNRSPVWKVAFRLAAPTRRAPSSPQRRGAGAVVRWTDAPEGPAPGPRGRCRIPHRHGGRRDSRPDVGRDGIPGDRPGGAPRPVAGWALLRFRRINGVRVDAFASQVVLGTGATATCTYVGAFVAATWGAFESQWWLVVVAAVVGGVGYALGARQWWRAYRTDPAAHAAGSSPLVLAILALAAVVGLVALVVVG